jgi:transposase-like protein
MQENKRPELKKSETIARIPKACADETAAVEFMEEQRWGEKPTCAHCDNADVYKMTDRDGTRNKRYLWRCRACSEQYTVRIGTVYEDSRLPLKHWCYAFWRASTSKKGVSALEIKRQCQISYKSALFLMHRIRFAMTPDSETAPKLGGTCEADECYIGGKPRNNRSGKPSGYRKDSNKIPVAVLVERGGNARLEVIPTVTSRNVFRFIYKNIKPDAVLNTDQSNVYNSVLNPVEAHHTVNHSKGEYVRVNPDGSVASTNQAESMFSL